MDEVMGAKRIPGFRNSPGGCTLGTQTENNARSDIYLSGSGNGKASRWQRLQYTWVGFQILGKIKANVGQGEVGDGDTGGEILQIDHSFLKLEQLLAAILQIVHLIAGLLLNKVLLTRSGDVETHHFAAYPLFKIDILLKLHIWPEVDKLNATVWRPDAVYPAKALDDSHWVPVNIVVDEPVTVLKVLPFGNAVGCDEQVDISLYGKRFRTLFGTRCKCTEKSGLILTQSR